MPDLRLEGCSPEPLAHYLKALGVLRLVSEQADPLARGFWDGDTFVLRSNLDEPALLAFFADRYVPTPLISPWNGGSGFHDGDQKAGIDAIAGSTHERLASYRHAILTARRVLADLGLAGKPDKDLKAQLATQLRSELADDALAWLDAALILTDDGLRFPPLLGTGGNDGRLEFANNHMQRLADLLLGPPAPELLRGALLGEPTAGLAKGKAVGQFLPAGVGGANASPGFTRDSLLNPWDFVLLLEGALLFAAAVTRRLEAAAPGTMAFPFTVRASASGYPSSASSDEEDTRDELWLPLWQAPAGLAELRALFAEGRAKVRLHDAQGVHSRPAGTGVDFARAIAGLGVARGLDSFVRFGFHVRNGLSYLATPLGRWQVPATPGEHVELLTPLDRWLDRFRRAATAKHAPASHARALRRLEAALLQLCRRSGAPEVQAVLIALGEAEAALARARGEADDLRPIPLLPSLWLERANDNSPEFRLAAALASADLRPRLVPIRRGAWLPRGQDDGRTVWTAADLVRNLHALLLRADIERSQTPTISNVPVPEDSHSDPHARPVPQDSRSADARPPVRAPRDHQPRRFAALADLAAFIAGELDMDRIEALARGLALLDWRSIPTAAPRPTSTTHPPAMFAALALALAWCPEGQVLRRSPGMLARAVAGDLPRAVLVALRRLQGYGLRTRPLIAALDAELRRPSRPAARDPLTARLTAALAFPLSSPAHRKLLDLLLPRHTHQATPDTSP